MQFLKCFELNTPAVLAEITNRQLSSEQYTTNHQLEVNLGIYCCVNIQVFSFHESPKFMEPY